MDYPHLTRILSAEFPKLKLDKNTKDLDKIGGIVVNGKLMSIEEFLASKNLKVNGDLDLSDNVEITFLPEGLEVNGYLDLGGTPITSLPKGLEVGGSLDLSFTEITSLPDDLKVKRLVYVDNPDEIQCSEELREKLV